ncbi:prepilin-type N-terminal cleavage/methylation domain-containing protein [Geomonas sp. Red32]|uniref:pilus assembly FimT family protein n=1 Tax=Geomonas sp. Red32 TaxID=2912856 RepID=UPI00202CC189|nr:prepilin-type N-terminal cleavage/methylation domain-containing protein [Geomonas sp. Red32]MCM0083691.1 prepilin-type N-terminal cleavage/methylation domain-containing protein [Geomonas sp. Red32]
MDERGYSLVEMMVVIGIIAILLAVGTLRFREYFRNYQVESQARGIQADIMRVKATAIYQRRPVRLKVYPTRLETYSTATDRDGGAEPVDVRVLDYPVVQSKTGNVLDFDETGTTENERTICTEGGEGAAVDSVVVGNIRVRIGKLASGSDCHGESVTSR